ncbi:hypothetical protein [Streptomyces sp. SLBN-118]|uniref:hypothetical protein n=1 Tax=Streptomyces sp. SLBN-118 TaxID=2768454 RepID=UPI00135C2A3F|nr:hypothetical protein [Streptomyces sp. SLBN-118]
MRLQRGAPVTAYGVVVTRTSWPASTREKVVRVASAAYLLAVCAAGARALPQP